MSESSLSASDAEVSDESTGQVGLQSGVGLTARIVDIWADVLDVERSTIDPATSGFFELGGYSLLALQAITRLLADLGIDEEQALEVEGVLLTELFEDPTPAAQAQCLERALLQVRAG